MPFGDATGPRGMGPMTGRALGFCAGYSAPGFAAGRGGRGGRGLGRGFGGGGGGFGWRNRYRATGTPGWAVDLGAAPVGPSEATTEDRTTALRRRADELRHALDMIEKQLGAMTDTEE